MLVLLCAAAFAAHAETPASATAPHEAPRFVKGATGPITFESSQPAPASDVWRSLAKAYDFDVLFSPKMRDREVEIRVRNASLSEVLDRLALSGDHFWKPLDGRTVLVANDTPHDRRSYQPETVQTLRLENLRVADAMTTLRSIYGIKHIAIDQQRQTMTLRDSAPRVALATELISRLDLPEDEVSVRLELVRVPEALWRRGADPSLLRSDRSQSLVRTQLGIVGQSGARFEVAERVNDAGDRLSVDVELEARVHPGSREVTLALLSQLATVDARLGEVAESKKTSSSWRLASGETHLVELPGGFAGHGDDVLALALTPKIVRVAVGETQPAQWLEASARPQLKDPEAARDEVRERLRQRLAEKQREQKEAGSD